MSEIANRAKITFNITAEISILKVQGFKALTGSSEEGGHYSYVQDRVLINRFPHIEWMIFHEFGHAYFARTLTRNKFLPVLVYGSTVDDDIARAVKIIWNGLCDCFINELVFKKASLKKFKKLEEVFWYTCIGSPEVIRVQTLIAPSSFF